MSDKELVMAWLEAFDNRTGLQPIADRFKVSRQYVSQRAQKLRGMGVDLPKLPRANYAKRPVPDVSELQQLVDLHKR